MQVKHVATVMVQRLDSWMVVKQVVTVAHGRMVVKRLVNHDVLQRKAAEFIEELLQRSSHTRLLNHFGDLVSQLSTILTAWKQQQQCDEQSSDEDDFGNNDDYQGSSDDDM